jgi:hypothetical protein
MLISWLGREDSNLRMAESKSAALPLGYAPPNRQCGERISFWRRRKIMAGSFRINERGGRRPTAIGRLYP